MNAKKITLATSIGLSMLLGTKIPDLKRNFIDSRNALESVQMRSQSLLKKSENLKKLLSEEKEIRKITLPTKESAVSERIAQILRFAKKHGMVVSSVRTDNALNQGADISKLFKPFIADSNLHAAGLTLIGQYKDISLLPKYVESIKDEGAAVDKLEVETDRFNIHLVILAKS